MLVQNHLIKFGLLSMLRYDVSPSSTEKEDTPLTKINLVFTLMGIN